MSTRQNTNLKARGIHKAVKAGEPERYIVRGALSFPIDMLRYDSCWPASEGDSTIIHSTIAYENKGAVEVTVFARAPLTVGRWESFGWSVLGCRERSDFV
jgi:hypothetical protein